MDFFARSLLTPLSMSKSPTSTRITISEKHCGEISFHVILQTVVNYENDLNRPQENFLNSVLEQACEEMTLLHCVAKRLR